MASARRCAGSKLANGNILMCARPARYALRQNMVQGARIQAAQKTYCDCGLGRGLSAQLVAQMLRRRWTKLLHN